MSPFLAELFGTAILIMLGDGVVANVVLRQTKGHNSGWIVITAGWACAVTIGVYCVNSISGAHLNPAVTIALAYLPHWNVTPEPDSKLAVFSTMPAIRKPVPNFISEAIGSFALVLAILAVFSPGNFVPGSDLAKGFGPVLVGAIVWAIGLSLGGPTGYAINPARDLGPRLAHAVLPIPGKRDADWGYAAVPVVGPLVGAAIAGVVAKVASF